MRKDGRNIVRQVAEYYNITVADIFSARRNREIARPRQIAMYIAREVVACPLTMIGDCFGKRDHSTVNHACNKVKEEMKTSPSLNNLINDLIQQLTER